jgi:septal ring factor EnvC (AmiA/AmiB activator)
VIDALKKQKDSFKDQQVKKEDLDKQIAAELDKLKGQDPQYQQLATSVKTITTTRDQLVKSIEATTTALEQANTKISEYWLQYAELLPQLDGAPVNIASQRADLAGGLAKTSVLGGKPYVRRGPLRL